MDARHWNEFHTSEQAIVFSTAQTILTCSLVSPKRPNSDDEDGEEDIVGDFNLADFDD